MTFANQQTNKLKIMQYFEILKSSDRENNKEKEIEKDIFIE